MKKAITINIPKPCHEDWNKMTPREKGRHCASCNKTVIDFTTKTDTQIIKTFDEEANLCGRFKAQQLNRKIVWSRKDKNNYLSIAASGLFAFLALGLQDIHAQGKPLTIKVDSLKTPHIKGKIANSILKEKMIHGNVTTDADGLPLPGASIIVKGTIKGTQTDFDGNYKIKAKVGDTLIFSFMGLYTRKIEINNSSIINIALNEDVCNQDIIIVGQASYTSNWNNKCVKAKRKEQKAKRIAKREAIKNGEQKRSLFGKFFFGIKHLLIKKK